MSMSGNSKEVFGQYNDAIKFSSSEATKLEKISKIISARTSLENFQKYFDKEIETTNPNRALWKKALTVLISPLFVVLKWGYKFCIFSMFALLFITEEVVRYNCA